MIAVIDYGAGNLRSVRKAFEYLGHQAVFTRSCEDVARATKIVLPGVGHFGQIMRALEELELRSTISRAIEAGTPFLGICLGMQILFAESEEARGVSGLGVFPEAISRFGAGLRVPHMGWNRLDFSPSSRLMRGIPASPYVYFANSYFAPETADTVATCIYESPFSAIIERNNVFGVQFHPEKSGETGLTVLRNFLEY